MKKTKASSTIQEMCPKCARHILACLCNRGELAASWPMSGAKPSSEAEMSARFSIIKEEGSGTVFLTSSSAPGVEPTTSIGLAPNAIIGGVYQIIRLIGRGTMGEVYQAKHLTLNKNCALKVIPPDQVTEVSWQRFMLEAKTVAKLDHVNIVRVTDLGIHDGCLPFYSMEYLDGKNLAELIAEDGPMTLQKAVEIFIQVCDGVECAHERGILHRDLKPANIMLTETPSGKLEVKILDFGLAKLIKDNRFKQSLTAVGDVFGSPSYMSPEQCGGEELDNRSDIYSIGCTLYECLTGRPPFYGQQAAAVFLGHLETKPPTLAQTVGEGKFPQSMESIVAKLLRKGPDQRYQKLSELKEDLEQVVRGSKQPNSRPTALKPSAAQSGNGKMRGGKERYGRASSESNQGQPITGYRSKRPMLIVMILLVVAGVGSCIGYEIYRSGRLNAAAVQNSPDKFEKVSSTEVTDADKVVAPIGVDSSDRSDHSDRSDRSDRRPGYADEDNWDGKPFYRGIVLKDGTEQQHWCYRSARQPLVFLNTESPAGSKRISLIGDVYIPASAKVSLSFRQKRSFPSNRLGALAKGNYDEINFGRYSFRDIEAMAPILAPCQSIKGLKIGDSDWTIEDSRASVEVINRFLNIERLTLAAEYEGAALSKIRNLRRLHALRLNRSQPFLHDCLKVIGRSTNLLTLGLPSWNLPLNDLAMLAAYPNLQTLTIGQLSGAHEELVALAKLPHLQDLTMPDLQYRSDLAADLSLLKSLKSLQISSTTEWSDTHIALLRRDLPEVQVIIHEAQAKHHGHSKGHKREDSGSAGADQ